MSFDTEGEVEVSCHVLQGINKGDVLRIVGEPLVVTGVCLENDIHALAFGIQFTASSYEVFKDFSKCCITKFDVRDDDACGLFPKVRSGVWHLETWN